jgi:uncharacterized Zn-finger protein
MTHGETSRANTQSIYEIHRTDLPLQCPPMGASLWSSHPRVYLPLGQANRARCPYRGAEYILKD